MSLLAQDERVTRRVGAVSLVVLALAILFFVFVYDRIEWGRHVRIRVYFHETGGLREGAPFIVAGRTVGSVEAIALSPRGAKTPLGGEEGVVVRVALDAHDARQLAPGDIFVSSRGALSGKYLELAAGPDPDKRMREGDEILGRDPPSLDRVLQRTWDNLTTVGKFSAEIRPELDHLRAELDTLRATIAQLAPDVAIRDDIDGLVDEARQTYDALGGEPGLDRIAALADHARATVRQVRAAVDALRGKAHQLDASLEALRGRLGTKGEAAVAAVEQAIDRVRAAIDKIDPLLAQVDALQQRIDRGEGSLLKLMHDPEFPEDAKELGKVLKRQPWKLMNRPPDSPPPSP